MNLAITISQRAFLALKEAAQRNQLTIEALASEAVQTQGINYANIYRIGIITSSELISRFTTEEIGKVRSASQHEQRLAALLDRFIHKPEWELDDPELVDGLQEFVSAGVLQPGRVTELLKFPEPIPPATT